jgi:acetyl esterase/lipase
MTLPLIPDSLWRTLDDVGPRWSSDIRNHSRRVAEGFSAILRNAPKLGEVTRDIAYGAHSRNVLDVYAPCNAARAPVVIFAHGGALVEGDKDRTPELYSNVCWFMTRHDMIGINLEYRLAPEARYPDVTEDVAAAVRWTRANIASFGGDPDNIFLFGHSAGALHVGSYAYDRRFHPAGGSGVAGLIVLSGRVRAETLPDNPLARNVEAYFGQDQEAMAQASMVTHVAPDSVPTLIGVAEYENPLIDVHSAELIHRLAMVKRRAPPFFSLARHNHSSTVAQINTGDDLVGPQIVAFVRGWGTLRYSAVRNIGDGRGTKE